MRFMPEIPSQYFLWAGLWAGATSLSSDASRLGALSGLAVGVAGLMRLDVLIHVAAGLALWKAFAPRHSWPAGRGFVPALAVMAAYAIVHQALFPTHYAAEMSPRLRIVLQYLSSYHLLDYRVAGPAALTLTMVAVALVRTGRTDGATLLWTGLRIAAMAAFAAYAVAIVATAWPDFATNLAWLRIYAGWPIALAAVIGVPCWLRRARNSAERFALVFALVATAQLFYYPPVSPQPLWAIRRFLRIAFPLAAIAAGLALSSLAGIGALIPRGAVIVGDPAFFAESQLHIAPWILRDAPAFFVSRTRTDSLRELRAAMGDRPMFWVGPTGRSPVTTGNLQLVPVANYTFSVATRRMEPYDSRDDLGLREISLALYRVDLEPGPQTSER
ncbi:MAG: hypothetical protein DMD97_01405 [Candidatus Rokuibacteriota bacterium]|nr:MAG: hypothetical protein DMD97_01405 [Candidatus Rokubacteria bacterium]